MKTCRLCGCEKSLAEFHSHPGTSDGLESRCIPCKRKNTRRNELRRKYGITEKVYSQILEAQGGVCAICGNPSSPGKSLAVDHDHESGAIRGLLCFECNTGLGKFRDSLDLLETAHAYLASAL